MSKTKPEQNKRFSFKLLTFMLAVFMLLSMLAACGGNKPAEPKTVITISESSLEMDLFDEAELTASASSGSPITWESSDPGTVSVNNGLLRALRTGGADITASADGESAACKVKVTKGAVPIILFNMTGSAVEIAYGDSFTVIPRLMFKGVQQSDASFTFEADDSGVFSVDNQGLVEALAKGQGVLTVKASWRGCTEPSMTEEIPVNVNILAAVNLSNYSFGMYTSDIYGGAITNNITATVTELGDAVPAAAVTWHEDAQQGDTPGAAVITSTGDLAAAINAVKAGVTHFYAKTTLHGEVIESLRIPVTVTQVALNTPAGLAYDNSTKEFTWTDDVNATSYTVKRDSTEVASASNPYTLAVNGLYAMSVKAIGNGGTIADSAWSAPVLAGNPGEGQLLDIDKDLYKNYIAENDVLNTPYWDVGNTIVNDKVFDPVYAGSTNGAVTFSFISNPLTTIAAVRIDLLAPTVITSNVVIRLKHNAASGIGISFAASNSTVYPNLNGCTVADDGGWTLLTIPAGLFPSPAEFIKIAFYKDGGEQVDVAIDWVKYGLDVPAGLAYDKGNNKVTWSAVSGAAGYTVDVDGTEYNVTNAEYPFSGTGIRLVKVKANHANSALSSGWSALITTISANPGELLEIDHEVYENFLSGKIVYNSYWYDSDYPGRNFSKAYVPGYSGASSGALTVTYESNPQTIGAIQINLLKPTVLESDVVIRVKHDAPIAYIYTDNTSVNRVTGCIIAADGATGWTLVTIPKSLFPATATHFIITFEAPDMTVVKVAFDWVKYNLNAPANLAYDDINNKVTWNAVSGAVSYTLLIDGTEHTNAVSPYSLTGIHSVSVKAIHATAALSSVWSAPIVTISANPGELLEMNHKVYEDYVVENNVLNTPWWDAGSRSNFTKAYDPAYSGSTGGAIALSWTNNYDVIAIRIDLLAPTVLASDVVIRVKHNIDIMGIDFRGSNASLPYPNLNGCTITADGAWTLLTIPKSLFPNPASFVKIVFYGYGGPATVEIAIDWVKYGLAAPTGLAYDDINNELTWNIVSGAASYTLLIDGVEHAGVTNPYPLTGIHSVKVKAVSANSALSSNWSELIVTMNIPEDELLEMTHEAYLNFVSGTGGYGTPWWDAVDYSGDFDPDYDGATNGAVIVDFKISAQTGSAITLTMFEPKTFSSSLPGKNKMQIRVKIDIEGTPYGSIYGFLLNGTTLMRSDWHSSAISVVDDGDGWVLITIDREEANTNVMAGIFPGSLSWFSIVVYGNAGDEVSMAIDWIRYIS